MKDIRLNPKLEKNCKMEMNKFCHDVISDRDNYKGESLLEGKVIGCLKEVFVKEKDQLTESELIPEGW